MDYDIIGDIHGHALALRHLLAHMGYQERRGAWRHPSRKAIFVGDFIDRGPRQRETVDIARRMVDSGAASAVMGNHEFNAIAWHTPDPQCDGEYLRPHSGAVGRQNLVQHKEFLAEFSDPHEHADAIEWFLTLPLWLDLPELRVVHACWSQSSMDDLQLLLTPERRLSRSLMEVMSRPGRLEFRAAECLTKGPEARLPSGKVFHDADGHERRSVRLKWWNSHGTTFRELAHLPADLLSDLPDEPVPSIDATRYSGTKPVFFGHYWMKGEPSLASSVAACVDYSVAKNGKLVGYRFEAGQALDAANFWWVGR